MAQNGLTRRLDALEAIAEQARVRELRRQLEEDARAANMRPDRIAGHVDRLLAIDRQVQTWLAAGVPRPEIVRQAAVMVGLDPEVFAQQFTATLEREYGGGG